MKRTDEDAWRAGTAALPVTTPATPLIESRTLSMRFVESSPADVLHLEMRAGRSGPVVIDIAAEGALLHPNADSLFAFGFLPACELQCDLQIDGSVSRSLLAAQGDLFALYARWYGHARQPRVVARERDDAVATGADTMLFFSGGVDSCYSLLEAGTPLRSLVTVVGADIGPQETEGAAWVTELGRRFSERFGLRPIVVRTAARRCFNRMVAWDHFHGPFLAGVAHLLAPQHGRALVAGTFAARGLEMPWGSHPDHERLYSSKGMQIEHHLPHNRLVKIRRLHEAGLTPQLRVCMRPVGGMNCGLCSKCTYLRLTLRLLNGSADSGVRFAREGSDVCTLNHLGHLENWNVLLPLAKARGETALVQMIQDSIQAFERTHARPVRWWQGARLHASIKRLKRRLRFRFGQLFPSGAGSLPRTH